MTDFNNFAINYDKLLDKSLEISGENHEYYSEKRITTLLTMLEKREF